MTGFAQFPQVDHWDAAGDLETTYDDIRLTLRVPWVAFACRVLATFPAFLPLAWRRSADAFGTLYAERAADELRERSLLGIDPALDLKEQLRSEGWDEDRIHSVRRVLNQLNYGNPKYLLLLTAWSERFQMRTAGDGQVPDDLRTSVSKGHPEGMDPLLTLIDPAQASVDVQKLLRRVADIHYHHGPASDFRVLAHWPDLLETVTERILSPVVRTELYDAKARELVTRARELAQHLPEPVGAERTELASICTPAELAGLTGVLFMYQRFIADITISIVHVTECLDGPVAASRSHFPVTMTG